MAGFYQLRKELVGHFLNFHSAHWDFVLASIVGFIQKVEIPILFAPDQIIFFKSGAEFSDGWNYDDSSFDEDDNYSRGYSIELQA